MWIITLNPHAEGKDSRTEECIINVSLQTLSDEDSTCDKAKNILQAAVKKAGQGEVIAACIGHPEHGSLVAVQ